MQKYISLQDFKNLEIIAKQLQSAIEATFQSGTYQDTIIGIEEQCKRLLCRAREWESKAFIIIVVGPVKSGKSTFVNILAHEKVSPTHFLECTVRPSIISKKKDKKAESQITSFITDGNPTIEHVDAIIDYIKGLNYADLGQIKEEDPCPLTDENLDRKVSYRIGLENTENEVVALTSITAKGGEFLQDDIFLIDMPGFDGVKANIDKPFYEAIINRADLVVFVQSSNSAINKISEKFCELMLNRNGAIPIYFIHNFYDSAYWYTEDAKKEVIKGHVEKALEFFKEQKMLVDKENCKCINLGKVTDARDMDFRKDSKKFLPCYDEMLNSENTLFSEIEHELHKKISSSQNRMRLQNCISRTVKEAEILCNLLKERESELQESKEKYERINNLFSELRKKIKPIDINSDVSLRDLIGKLQDINKQFCKNIDYEAYYNTKNTRAKGRELIRIYRDTTARFIDDTFKTSDIQQKIQEKCYSMYISTIPPELSTEMSLYENIQLPEEIIEFDYSSIENEYDIESRIERWYTKTRKGKDVVECMTDIEHTLFGLSSANPCGLIPHRFYPSLKNKIKTWTEKIADGYYKYYTKKIDDTKAEILTKIIPDISKHDDEINKIEELLEKINRITNSINISSIQ